MKKLLAALVLLPSMACAGELWGVLNLASLHSKTKNSLNQFNPGLGLEYHHSKEVLFMAGAYRNSHKITSGYVLAAWTPVEWGPARIGLTAGIAHGYPRHNDGNVIPIVTGLIRLEGERFGANIYIIPPALKKSPLTLGFQLKYRF